MSRTKHHGKREKIKKFCEELWWRYDTESSIWTRNTMNVPKRRKCKEYIDKLKKVEIEDLDLVVNEADDSNKPKVYWW